MGQKSHFIFLKSQWKPRAEAQRPLWGGEQLALGSWWQAALGTPAKVLCVQGSPVLAGCTVFSSRRGPRARSALLSQRVAVLLWGGGRSHNRPGEESSCSSVLSIWAFHAGIRFLNVVCWFVLCVYVCVCLSDAHVHPMQAGASRGQKRKSDLSGNGVMGSSEPPCG